MRKRNAESLIFGVASYNPVMSGSGSGAKFRRTGVATLRPGYICCVRSTVRTATSGGGANRPLPSFYIPVLSVLGLLGFVFLTLLFMELEPAQLPCQNIPLLLTPVPKIHPIVFPPLTFLPAPPMLLFTSPTYAVGYMSSFGSH